MKTSVDRRRGRVSRRSSASQRGASTIELWIVITIMATILILAVMSQRNSQTLMRRSSAAQEFATYIEKARADSVRRHADAGAESQVRITSATTYTVTLDFNYDGATETRTITLPPRITFVYDATNPPTAIVFDWRGRVADVSGVRPMRANGQADLALNLSNSGDIAVNRSFITPTTPTATPISTDINATAAFTPTP